MSLILDALQQAEHERGRDRAPDLFGPAVGTAAPPPASPPPTRWPWALAGVALLVATGAMAWALWLHPLHTAREASATAPVAPVTAPAAAAPPTPDSAPFNPPPAAPVVAVTAAQPTPPVTATAQPTPMLTRGAGAPTAPTPTAPPLTADAPTPAATELPPEVRARLPGLTITGHTYSDNPTLRTLMIDGRMFVEGQALQPGLRLERIGPNRAVFNHQGTRFAVDY
jgi:general secretion pathway protein B